MLTVLSEPTKYQLEEGDNWSVETTISIEHIEHFKGTLKAAASRASHRNSVPGEWFRRYLMNRIAELDRGCPRAFSKHSKRYVAGLIFFNIETLVNIINSWEWKELGKTKADMILEREKSEKACLYDEGSDRDIVIKHFLSSLNYCLALLNYEPSSEGQIETLRKIAAKIPKTLEQLKLPAGTRSEEYRKALVQKLSESSYIDAPEIRYLLLPEIKEHSNAKRAYAATFVALLTAAISMAVVTLSVVKSIKLSLPNSIDYKQVLLCVGLALLCLCCLSGSLIAGVKGYLEHVTVENPQDMERLESPAK